jgi:hypothetical protein
VFEGVFAVRWRVFTLEALAELRREISRARGIVGRRLVYLSLIPASPRDFSAEERVALGAFVRDLLVHDCASLHHVIDGAGFYASARRSIVTALAVATARPEDFGTHATLEDALAALAPAVGAPASVLLEDARKRGIPFH